MTVKHRGGRGRRAPNKHETVTISLPPHLKAALDAAVTPEVSRSEVVAQLIAQHLRPQAAQAAAQAEAPRKPRKAPAAPQPERKPRPSRAKSTPALPPAVTVLQQHVPRGLKWKPEKYAIAERLLAQGHTLTRMSDGADYSTETGEVMSWRTVEALLKRGVVVALV